MDPKVLRSLVLFAETLPGNYGAGNLVIENLSSNPNFTFDAQVGYTNAQYQIRQTRYQHRDDPSERLDVRDSRWGT